MGKGPAWLDDAIFYEIYPQSFYDTNGDGIGDFNGIVQKLDYIKNLGFNAIWMNPCFESPFGDAGYDISDYYKTASRYGTNEDLKKLFEEIHKRDMHIMLDLVPGHTSVEHKWFKESMKAEQNEFTDRYIWTDNIGELPEGNECIKGFSDRDGCCVINYYSHQPALNYGYYRPDPNKKWQQSMDDEGPKATIREMKNIMSFWLGLGCDGFRVDMAGTLVKGDEDFQGSIKLWSGVIADLEKEFPNAALVAEWGDPDKSSKAGFHMDFLLHFGPSHYMDLFRCNEPYFSQRGKGDISKFVENYVENYKKTHNKSLVCIPSGNHDMLRLPKFIEKDNLKIVFAFILSMPGAPFVYYGDEIGMRYVEGLVSVEGGYFRTGSRTPMQWDNTTNAGFSSAPKEMLYMRQDESDDRPTVAQQINDSNSLYNEIKKLISIRKEHKALQNRSEIEFIYAVEMEYPLAYIRSCDDEKILVVVNPANRPTSFTTDIKSTNAIYSYGGEIIVSDGNINVPAKSVGFYLI